MKEKVINIVVNNMSKQEKQYYIDKFNLSEYVLQNTDTNMSYILKSHILKLSNDKITNLIESNVKWIEKRT